MEVQNIFYGVGALFIIASVIYFSFEFLRGLDQNIKFFLLVVAVIVSFVVAELLRMGDH